MFLRSTIRLTFKNYSRFFLENILPSVSLLQVTILNFQASFSQEQFYPSSPILFFRTQNQLLINRPRFARRPCILSKKEKKKTLSTTRSVEHKSRAKIHSENTTKPRCSVASGRSIMRGSRLVNVCEIPHSQLSGVPARAYVHFYWEKERERERWVPMAAARFTRSLSFDWRLGYRSAFSVFAPRWVRVCSTRV